MNTIIRRAIMMGVVAVAEAAAISIGIQQNIQKALDRIGNHPDRGRRIQAKI